MHHPALPPQGAPNRERRGRRALRIAILPVAGLVLSGCTIPSFGAHPGQSTSSKQVFHLWQGFSIAGVIIGGLTLALMIWAIFRYRRRGDAIPPQTQYHLPLEVIYTVVPILVVIGLFAATLVVENKETANPATNVIVNVNAFQWGWQFTYPGSNALVYGQTTQSPEMVLPVNESVHFSLTSTDVVHGFYVAAFNFSRYALPGVDNIFTIMPTKIGTYFGQCTQLCGLYHSLMYFRVKVVSDANYKLWLASFNNAAAAARYAAAVQTTNTELSSGTPSKAAYTNFGTGATNG